MDGTIAGSAMASRFGREPPFLIVQGFSIIERATTEEDAIRKATKNLRRMIEQQATGAVKVLDGSGRVLWREYAGL